MESHHRAPDRSAGGIPAAAVLGDGPPAAVRLRPAAAATALLCAALLACGPVDEAADRERPATGERPETAARTTPPGEARDGREEPAYGIRLTTDRAVYAPGDTIRARLEAFRRGGDPLTLSFPTAQRHDFVLRGPDASGPDDEIWRWSEGRHFAQSTATVTLDADRPSITATVAQPAPATPGLYRLEGRIVASEWPVSAVVPVSVAP